MRRLPTSSVGRKGIMAISGLLLSLFILLHAAGNSTWLFGTEAFNAYAGHLHDLGRLLNLLEIGLVLLLLLHVVLGVLLTLENYRARPSRYQATKNSGGRTPGSRTMIFSGLLILVFLAVHLKNFHFTDHSRQIAVIVKEALARPMTGAFYLLALAGLGLHLSHGLWSMLQSLGVNHPKYNNFIHGSTLLLALTMAGIFTLITALALLWPAFLD